MLLQWIQFIGGTIFEGLRSRVRVESQLTSNAKPTPKESELRIVCTMGNNTIHITHVRTALIAMWHGHARHVEGEIAMGRTCDRAICSISVNKT